MKERWSRRPGAAIFLLISYCLWAAVSLRWITVFVQSDHPLTWTIGGMMLLYGLLLGLEPLLTGGSNLRAQIGSMLKLYC